MDTPQIELFKVAYNLKQEKRIEFLAANKLSLKDYVAWVATWSSSQDLIDQYESMLD
jgi:hypothetical protein